MINLNELTKGLIVAVLILSIIGIIFKLQLLSIISLSSLFIFAFCIIFIAKPTIIIEV